MVRLLIMKNDNNYYTKNNTWDQVAYIEMNSPNKWCQRK